MAHRPPRMLQAPHVSGGTVAWRGDRAIAEHGEDVGVRRIVHIIRPKFERAFKGVAA